MSRLSGENLKLSGEIFFFSYFSLKTLKFNTAILQMQYLKNYKS